MCCCCCYLFHAPWHQMAWKTILFHAPWHQMAWKTIHVLQCRVQLAHPLMMTSLSIHYSPQELHQFRNHLNQFRPLQKMSLNCHSFHLKMLPLLLSTNFQTRAHTTIHQKMSPLLELPPHAPNRRP
ncbi:hypothetical protein VPH35_098239 [Triticum aestivum]